MFCYDITYIHVCTVYAILRYICYVCCVIKWHNVHVAHTHLILCYVCYVILWIYIILCYLRHVLSPPCREPPSPPSVGGWSSVPPVCSPPPSPPSACMRSARGMPMRRTEVEESAEEEEEAASPDVLTWKCSHMLWRSYFIVIEQ